jgi:hypothetical protein
MECPEYAVGGDVLGALIGPSERREGSKIKHIQEMTPLSVFEGLHLQGEKEGGQLHLCPHFPHFPPPNILEGGV